jgi:hypothetical protein
MWQNLKMRRTQMVVQKLWLSLDFIALRFGTASSKGQALCDFAEAGMADVRLALSPWTAGQSAASTLNSLKLGAYSAPAGQVIEKVRVQS